MRSILLYNCSTWSNNLTLLKNRDAFHRKQLRKCLHINYPKTLKMIDNMPKPKKFLFQNTLRRDWRLTWGILCDEIIQSEDFFTTSKGYHQKDVPRPISWRPNHIVYPLTFSRRSWRWLWQRNCELIILFAKLNWTGVTLTEELFTFN